MSERQTMSLAVRLARPGDEQALAALNGLVHQLHLANRPEHFHPTRPEEVAAWFKSLIQEFSVRIWMAEDRGSAIGYVSVLAHEQGATPFSFARRWYELDQIVVTPAFRRRGVARSLVQAVLEAALAHGIRELEISSWSFNQSAHAALRRLGFKPKSIHFGLELPSR